MMLINNINNFKLKEFNGISIESPIIGRHFYIKFDNTHTPEDLILSLLNNNESTIQSKINNFLSRDINDLNNFQFELLDFNFDNSNRNTYLNFSIKINSRIFTCEDETICGYCISEDAISMDDVKSYNLFKEFNLEYNYFEEKGIFERNFLFNQNDKDDFVLKTFRKGLFIF